MKNIIFDFRPAEYGIIGAVSGMAPQMGLSPDSIGVLLQQLHSLFHAEYTSTAANQGLGEK